MRISLFCGVLLIGSSGIIFSGQKPPSEAGENSPHQISDIYPHLAYYNTEGECGTSAVVSWADRLWVVTYGPHRPFGSSDKLYETTSDLDQIVWQEYIGGTPANRMIYQESKQLFISPYGIDRNRNVQSMSYEVIPGLPTGLARHLTQPEERIYLPSMEEGFYDIDVHTLKGNTLHCYSMA